MCCVTGWIIYLKRQKAHEKQPDQKNPEENGFSDMSLPGCDDQHSFVLVSTPLIFRARFKAFPSKGGNAGSGQGSKKAGGAE